MTWFNDKGSVSALSLSIVFVENDIISDPICEIELTDEERQDSKEFIRNIAKNLDEYIGRLYLEPNSLIMSKQVPAFVILLVSGLFMLFIRL